MAYDCYNRVRLLQSVAIVRKSRSWSRIAIALLPRLTRASAAIYFWRLCCFKTIPLHGGFAMQFSWRFKFASLCVIGLGFLLACSGQPTSPPAPTFAAAAATSTPPPHNFRPPHPDEHSATTD